jgi:hypothetical protein
MFTVLQALFALRGLKRWLKLTASRRRRTPSIQPWQRASSSASRYVRPLPAPTFDSRIRSSGAVPWFRSSQARNSAGPENPRGCGARLRAPVMLASW